MELEINGTFPECTSQGVDLIKPIDKGTVHRICSGQVVVNLSIAMKELIENSIDANATNISIHLREYGSELLEVSDNGTGITEENFEVLTKKHYTSKIQNFEDLSELSTLGFRGEALSSLCALCELSVVTKHDSAEFATKILYDNNGRIKEKAITAREQGTTVSLESLFATLPVRRKEFMKNLKRDFTKMCQLLYSYCLVSKGIKFTCTNTVNSNRNLVVSTEGSDTLRENIINVFGAKQLSTLIEVETIEPDDSIITEYDIRLVPGETLPFTLEFYISSVVHGSGRSSADRQFFFINGRPCEQSKLIKLVNKTYKQFNSNQYPFVYLNVVTKALTVDVNVTPDKRQVFLENEKLLLATVKASLVEAFKNFPATYRLQNMDLSQGMKRSFTEPAKVQQTFESYCKKSKSEEIDSPDSFNFSKFSKDRNTRNKSRKSEVTESPTLFDLSTFNKGKSCTRKSSEGSQKSLSAICEDDTPTKTPILQHIDKEIEEEADRNMDMLIDIACKLTQKKEDAVTEADLDVIVDSHIKPNRNEEIMDISLESIEHSLQKINRDEQKTPCVKFYSDITPESNKHAEDELERQISKTDFAKMEIIGQFNLGFIITRLDSDLFIIDQHATDEKYNFEQLQQNTVIDSQVLVNPKCLELTAGEENMLIENLDVFKRNGFLFKINESAPCTKKVALTSIPISKNFVFGRDDIQEMLFMLQESGNLNCRPSRLRSMFALRACRKSVMIGKALSKTDMRKLVDHMGEIDQPWNCPHGRPTMRHLINLDLIKNPTTL